MSSESFKRKLSAILSADVAGYSRLMSQDEIDTIRRLKGYRQLMVNHIKRCGGRVVDSPGDNILAEFTSVVDALECAVDVQKELKKRNESLPPEKKMEFRIGINLGDIVEDDNRIYGDGVNIAARLESLAEPGGICISGFVYHQVKNRLKLEYEYLGEQSVKNIKEPVPVYRVLSLPGAAAHRVIEAKKVAEKEITVSSVQDKPSIAVLPFVNMSEDPEQEYFSDGMSEEIIGALAKLEGLKVISRTSAFYFKGKDVKLRQVAEELKVDHILEGSVRKAGNQLRISAQLIKVDDDTHLWSENYNRELKDVFAIQEEISQAVVQNLKVKLLGEKTEPLVKDYTQNTEAYELFLKGMFYWNQGFFGYEKAVEYMEKAIEVDPDYVPAYVNMAGIHYVTTHERCLPPWEFKTKLNALIQKAIELDENYGLIYVAMARDKIDEYDWQGVEKSSKRALELNPGLSMCHHGYATYLAAIGRVDEALLEVRHAVELDPLSSWHRAFLGWYLSILGQFEEAIAILKETLEFDPHNLTALSILSRAYEGQGMYDKAISFLLGFSDIPPAEIAHLGYLYGKAGNMNEAQKILKDLLGRSKKGYFPPYLIAGVYSGLGDKDRVFEWLDRAYRVQDITQFHIKIDGQFDNLHSDPRWTEQMQKRGLAD